MLSIRLKELREELNLNQEEVARRINVSRSTYASYESGRAEPSISTLIEIAKLYDVSIDYLCGFSDIKNNIYNDNNLCEYINECILIYKKFLKNK